MENPLYQMLNNQPTNNIFQRFNQFRQMFKGDPKQQVQELLNSGKVTQAQYNAAVEQAKQLQQLLK